MDEVNIGIIGLGNVGTGTITILAENADQIALKLGFRLRLAAACSLDVHERTLPASLGNVLKTTNWRAMLADMKADKDTYTSTKNEKLDVRMFGNGFAVVVGTAREKGSGKDGKAFDRAYRFTDTWVDRNGKWQCVASQASLVSGK